MRVSLPMYKSHDDVEPKVGLAVHSRTLDAELRVCAPPDFAEQLPRAGVPVVAVGVWR